MNDLAIETMSEVGSPDPVPARKFLFDHIPKTGGTAFRSILEKIFGARNVSPWSSGRSELWAREKYAEYPVITGHFHSPIPVKLRPDGRARVTMLRDPIDRAVSEYYYYRNDVERAEWNKLAVLAKDHDLYGYLQVLESTRDTAVCNFYTRRFASQVSRQFWSRKKILHLAKEALDRYDFVGIQEQFVDSVDLFCCEFGLPPVHDLPQINVTSSREKLHELDRRTRDKIVEMNRLDVELYGYAANTFQNRKRKILHGLTGQRGTASPAKRPGDAGQSHAVRSESFGDRTVEFSAASVRGERSGSATVRPGEGVTIRLEIAAHADVPDLTVGMEISDELGEIVFGTNTYLLGQCRPVRAGERSAIAFSFPANLKHGRYAVGAALHTGATHEERCFHWCDRLASFDVADDAASDFVGYCRLAPEVEWTSA